MNHRVRANRWLRLPQSGDTLYLDGFPRSGNTYFSAAVRDLLPTVRFAHHLHCLAPLKIAVDQRVPSCVLLRRPIEAISSRFIQLLNGAGHQSHLGKIDFDRLHWLLEDWLSYYEYVVAADTKVHVIPFEEATSQPWSALSNIFEFAELSVPPDLESRWEVFHTGFASRDANKAQGSTSFPDERRNELKQPVMEHLSALEEMQRANELYGRLSASVSTSRAHSA